MLTEKDYIGAANFLGCEAAVIKAVTKIEAPRGAYSDNGAHLALLFEPYIFWKELKKKGIDPAPLAEKFPTLISSKWEPNIYGKNSIQWDKLQGAANINAEAAYRSASYGLFQIMGNNAESLGYKDVFEFYNFLFESEHNQLIAFCKYVKVNSLDDELINKDWDGFALGYNGPRYRENNYAQKLKAAYVEARS